MDIQNEVYVGAQGKRSVYDLHLPKNWNKEIILFMHGYKGYKDWGAWQLMGKAFTDNGYGFCAFNFSHNGGTTENPIDFPDLEAFANNRYSYELEDAQIMVNLLLDNYNPEKLHIIGHSRGGGIACLCAAQTPKVDSLVTLNAVDDFERRFIKGEALKAWQVNGVFTVKNGRTQQDMPHNFSFYEDYFLHEAKLNILQNLNNIEMPALHIHGEMDETVDKSCSLSLAQHSKGKYVEIANAGHTFNTKHPWDEKAVSLELENAIVEILNFYHSNNGAL